MSYASKGSKTDTVGYVWSNENGTFLQSVIGGIALLSFITIWLSSLASPILLGAFIFYQKYAIASVLIVLVICAYLPWKKGFLSNIITSFARYNVLYYKRCSVILKGRSSKDVKKPNFYAVHPHGAFCLGWSILFCSPQMTSVRFCFSPALYASPFFRLWSRFTGKPGRADKASLKKYMRRGEHIALPPGGFEEATLTSPSHDRVYIRKRFGFVKLALQHGYNIVPVYTFGENKTYLNVQGGWKARLKLNSFGIPAILVYGASLLPILPRRHKHGLFVVAGEPLELPNIADPSREEVKLWHDKYIAALIKLFEDHKGEAYGDEEGKTKKMELW